MGMFTRILVAMDESEAGTEAEAYATELANTNISVYTLMKLLGHESMATSQRYVISAGSETKAAAAQNPLYDLAGDQGGHGPK